MPNAKTILLVDDIPGNLGFVMRFLERRGYAVVTAEDGASAIKQFLKHQPDLVLMDIMLPDRDGRDVTREIKALSTERWVPVIYMSALTDENDQVRAIEAGGDDYITKPVNLRLLGTRIDALQRIAETRRSLEITTSQLREYQTRAEQETLHARELMDKLIYHDRLDDPLLRTWHVPAQWFSGDFIGATRSTAQRLYVMVGDSTGHGLTAALPLLQLSQVFYTMAERGFSLSTIAKEMNDKTLARMPADRFVCAVLAIIDPTNHTLELWCGGLPPPMLFDHKGHCIRQFAPRHPPLGIAPPEVFDASTELYQWTSSSNLLIYSDGLIEAENNDGCEFGDQALAHALHDQPLGDQFRALQQQVLKHIGEHPTRDDISLIMVHCPIATRDGSAP